MNVVTRFCSGRLRQWWRRVVLTAAAAMTTSIAVGADVPAPVVESDVTPAQILVMIRMAPAHFRPDVDYGDGYAGRSGHAARRRAALDIAQTHGLQLRSHWPMPTIGVECFVMDVRPDVAPEQAAAAVSRDPRAAWAQAVQTFTTLGYNDPLFDLQPVAHAWQLAALHATTTGRGVSIAQIDSGVEADHPDLRGQFRLVRNVVADRPFAAEQHGTAVAGVIGAHADNGIGIVGVAPGARLLAYRGCWESASGGTVCDSLSLATALQLALDQGARIVNLSVGGPPDRLLRELLDAAAGLGVIVIAAAGAETAELGFPASHPGVIAVADSARVAPSTTLLVAPGRDVPATLPGGRWGFVSGASYAAAEVTGMVALLLELAPGARAPQIEAMLRRAAVPSARSAAVAPTPIDACRSVSIAAGRCVCGCSAEASLPTTTQH